MDPTRPAPLRGTTRVVATAGTGAGSATALVAGQPVGGTMSGSWDAGPEVTAAVPDSSTAEWPERFAGGPRLRTVSYQVLVVEDDDGIAIPLVRTLEREGYAVERVAEGLLALRRAKAGDIDLVVLDLGLPDIDGLEVCRRLRADGYDRGILILTARGGELDRVVGLDVGADDYMAKPFGLAEMLARTRALLRRSGGRQQAAAPEPATASGKLSLDPQSRRVWVDGDEVALTTKEFDVLALLCEERGAVVTRDRLMDEVWDSNWYGSTKTLDVTIGRLRQKLDESRSTTRVVTVRGVGFRLEDGAGDA